MCRPGMEHCSLCPTHPQIILIASQITRPMRSGVLGLSLRIEAILVLAWFVNSVVNSRSSVKEIWLTYNSCGLYSWPSNDL